MNDHKALRHLTLYVWIATDTMDTLDTLDIELRRTTLVGVIPDFKKTTGCLS